MITPFYAASAAILIERLREARFNEAETITSPYGSLFGAFPNPVWFG
jgi:hypothetical protein